MRRELDRTPADVVHVNTQAIALGAAPVRRDVPLLVSADATVWDWRVLSRREPVRRYSRALLRPCLELERRLFERAHTVLAYTDWARDRIAAAAPRARVVTRNPGIDIERFRPAARRPRSLPRILFVGGRFAEKGGDDLLAAVADLVGTRVELDVVTSQPPAPRSGLRVHRLGRSDPALLDLVQQADLFCLPTYADTMSFATIEAMACATPVIVSSVAALPEVVGDEGMVVPPRDVRALREAIEGMLSDEGRRRELGDRGRKRAEAQFDARAQTAALVDVAIAAADESHATEPRRLTRGAA